MPGMRELEENIAKLEAANEETRAATREAHEAIKTSKLVLKELKEERDRWEIGIRDLVDIAIMEQVRLGLESFNGQMKDFTFHAHDKVIAEFDKLKNLLMYGNETGKGSSLVEDWVVKLVREEIRRIAGQGSWQ